MWNIAIANSYCSVLSNESGLLQGTSLLPILPTGWWDGSTLGESTGSVAFPLSPPYPGPGRDNYFLPLGVNSDFENSGTKIGQNQC